MNLQLTDYLIGLYDRTHHGVTLGEFITEMERIANDGTIVINGTMFKARDP